jgi:hypothetical protein
MKKTFTHIILSLFTVIVAAGCSKDVAGSPIEFAVSTPDMSISADAMTKGEITSGNIESANVYVVGYEDGKPMFSNGYYSTVKINKSGNVWLPPDGKKWDDAKTYTFYGYAYTVPSGTTLNIYDSGHRIEVLQPASYSEGMSADYLLSDQLVLSPSKVHPLVPIALKHAMSKIKINVVRAIGMSSFAISDLSVTLSNIITGASLTYTGGTWSTIPTMNTGTYSKEGISIETVSPAAKTEINMMDFIAIPAPNSTLKGYTLSITYKYTPQGESTPTTFSKSFNLGEADANNWQSGHLITYNLIIDNGIHLRGSITDWGDGGDIEGTILPPLPTE